MRTSSIPPPNTLFSLRLQKVTRQLLRLAFVIFYHHVTVMIRITGMIGMMRTIWIICDNMDDKDHKDEDDEDEDEDCGWR